MATFDIYTSQTGLNLWLLCIWVQNSPEGKQDNVAENPSEKPQDGEPYTVGMMTHKTRDAIWEKVFFVEI